MLHANTIDRALNVGAEPSESVGRAVIDGCVVTYDLDAPPRWLALLLADRDEDGNTDEFAPKRAAALAPKRTTKEA